MLNTLFAIALLVLAVGLGLAFPVYVPQSAWLIFVFIYVIIACVTPVWALLQPRDYLNSYLLIAVLYSLQADCGKRKRLIFIPGTVRYHCLRRCIRLSFPGSLGNGFQTD